MSRLVTYGWEDSDSTAPTSRTGGFETVAVSPIAGAKSGQIDASDLTGTSHRDNWVLAGVNNHSYYMVFEVRISGSPSAALEWALLGNTSGGFMGKIRVNTDRTLNLIRNASTVVGSASAALVAGQIHTIGLRVKLGTTTSNGEVEAQLDGVTFASATGVNLGTALAMTDMRIGNVSSSGGGGGVTSTFDSVRLNDDQGAAPDNTWPAIAAPAAASLVIPRAPHRGLVLR